MDEKIKELETKILELEGKLNAKIEEINSVIETVNEHESSFEFIFRKIGELQRKTGLKFIAGKFYGSEL